MVPRLLNPQIIYYKMGFKLKSCGTGEVYFGIQNPMILEEFFRYKNVRTIRLKKMRLISSSNMI